MTYNVGGIFDTKVTYDLPFRSDTRYQVKKIEYDKRPFYWYPLHPFLRGVLGSIFAGNVGLVYGFANGCMAAVSRPLKERVNAKLPLESNRGHKKAADYFAMTFPLVAGAAIVHQMGKNDSGLKLTPQIAMRAIVPFAVLDSLAILYQHSCEDSGIKDNGEYHMWLCKKENKFREE